LLYGVTEARRRSHAKEGQAVLPLQRAFAAATKNTHHRLALTRSINCHEQADKA
jgi:hypothetical protein